MFDHIFFTTFLRIYIQIPIATAVNDHGDIISTKPHIELNAFKFVLNSSSERLHRILRAKEAAAMANDHCTLSTISKESFD